MDRVSLADAPLANPVAHNTAELGVGAPGLDQTPANIALIVTGALTTHRC